MQGTGARGGQRRPRARNAALARLVATHLLAVVAEYAAVVAVLVFAFDEGGSRATGLVSLAILGAGARGLVRRRRGHQPVPAGSGAAGRAGRPGPRVRDRRRRHGGWLAAAGGRRGRRGARRREHPAAHGRGPAAGRRAVHERAHRGQPLDLAAASAPPR